MAIFPLAPDQTIAQMWSNGVFFGGWFTCQHCDTHYFSRLLTRNLPIVGLLLVRRTTSSATEPTEHKVNANFIG